MIPGFQCYRCGYTWVPRIEGKEPKICPNKKCKSPYWNKPRTSSYFLHGGEKEKSLELRSRHGSQYSP